MTLNWQSAELMIGQNWQQWGMPYYVRNDRQQRLSHSTLRASGHLRWLFAISSPKNLTQCSVSPQQQNGQAQAQLGVRQYNDDYARSSWPGVMGEIAYWTDRCGKIGPNNLKFALGGYYGRESKTYGVVTNGTGSVKDDTINAWMTAFRYSVPIIPEKQGNKAMALLLNGNFFYGQNLGGNNWMSPGVPNPSKGSYFRNASFDAAAPTVFGLYTQASFWFTNNLWINGMYGYLKYNYSGYARDIQPDNVNMMQTYAVNLLWDANQAIRFGLQWMTMFTGYNRPGLGATNGVVGTGIADRTGQVDQYRFAAWYFF